MPYAPSTRTSLLLVVHAAVLAGVALLLGCGGGTEVAPSNPVVRGTGMGQVTFDGTDKGPTEEVASIVSSTDTRTVNVASESVTFDASGRAQLGFRPLTLTSVVLSGPGGPFSSADDPAACSGNTACPFSVDVASGILQINPAFLPVPLPTGTAFDATYQYTETLLGLEVAITYPVAGELVTITVFNVRTFDTGPFTTTMHSTSRPTDPAASKAFHVRFRTRFLESSGQQEFASIDNAMNRLDVTLVDVSNSLDPCIQGHLVAAMNDVNNPDPLNPMVLDATFDDPVCP